MIVYFKNSYGDIKEIGQTNNEFKPWAMNDICMGTELSEEIDIIMDFLKEHNYKSFYQRFWFDPKINKYIIDVGSHTEFFSDRRIKRNE